MVLEINIWGVVVRDVGECHISCYLCFELMNYAGLPNVTHMETPPFWHTTIFMGWITDTGKTIPKWA